jgi:hypothetical protein
MVIATEPVPVEQDGFVDVPLAVTAVGMVIVPVTALAVQEFASRTTIEYAPFAKPLIVPPLTMDVQAPVPFN